MGRSLDKEGTAVLFKTLQACDKDACLARNCFLQYFIGQCRNGEHGLKDVHFNLILEMTCHHFWIWDLQMISWYSRGRPMKSWRCWTNWLSSWVMQAQTWMRKNCVDHNTSPATAVFDYFDWSHYQGKGKGIGSQMVRLHVVCSQFQTCNSGYWLSFTICESSFLCQQVDFSEQKCFHQKQTEIFRCHRDTNRLFWSWAPVHS